MATFDQVTVKTSNFTDVAFQTDPGSETQSLVSFGVDVAGTACGVRGTSFGGTAGPTLAL